MYDDSTLMSECQLSRICGAAVPLERTLESCSVNKEKDLPQWLSNRGTREIMEKFSKKLQIMQGKFLVVRFIRWYH